MNGSAQVSGVKALSDDDRANHLMAINEHRKAMDCHQRGIQAHLKSMLDIDDADDDVDDPALLEDGDDGKAFLLELRKLAEQPPGTGEHIVRPNTIAEAVLAEIRK